MAPSPSRAAAESALRALAREHGLCESTLRPNATSAPARPALPINCSAAPAPAGGAGRRAPRPHRVGPVSMALRPWPFLPGGAGPGARHPGMCWRTGATSARPRPWQPRRTCWAGMPASISIPTRSCYPTDVLLAEARTLRAAASSLEAPQATLAPTPAHGEAVTGAADRTVSAGRARRRRQADTLPLPFSD